MEFHFVNNNTPPDRHSQKTIRSHAMKGKNLGKTVPGRGRKFQLSKSSVHNDQPIQTSGDLSKATIVRPLLPKPSENDISNDLAAILRLTSPRSDICATGLSYFATSDLSSSSSRYLFHQFHYLISETLYPRLFCRPSKKVEISWFELMVTNPCVLHCGIAMTEAYISRRRGEVDMPLKSLRHFAESLRFIRLELSSNTSPPESSLGAIISLAIHATLIGNLDESRIHLNGLKHIIESRANGLMGLCADAPEVGNKVRRTDLDLALMAGTPTLFGSYSPLPAIPYVVPLNLRKRNETLPYPLNKTSAALQFVMRDVQALCSRAGSSQFDPFQYQDIIITISQRLTDYAPLAGPRPFGTLDSICQLGYLAFMGMITHYDPRERPVCSLLLSQALWTELDRFYTNILPVKRREDLAFSLWLFFVYAVSAPEDETCRDTVALSIKRIRVIADALLLRTWEDVTAELTLYGWISEFHDMLARKLWRPAEFIT